MQNLIYNFLLKSQVKFQIKICKRRFFDLFIITVSHKFLSEDETNQMLEVIEMRPLYEEITKRSQAEALDNVFKAIELLKEHKEIDYIAEKTHLPKERIISLKKQIQQ